MTFNFEQALQKALNQMRKERDEIHQQHKEHPTPILKAKYEVYQSVVERLDSLL